MISLTFMVLSKGSARVLPELREGNYKGITSLLQGYEV